MKISDTVHRMADVACPHCGHRLDSNSGLSTEDGPSVGDYSVCINCAGWVVYTDGMGLRPISAEEIAGLDDEQQTNLNEITRLIKIVHEKFKS